MATTQQQLADDYGYQLAFLKSDPELYKVFQQAVAGAWDGTRFVAAVRNTKWYKTHSETYRNNAQLKYTDPATYQKQLAEKTRLLMEQQRQMGSTFSAKAIANFAEQALMFGWDDQKIKTTLATGLHIGSGAEGGSLGEITASLRNIAWRNGVNVSNGYIENWAKRISSGYATMENATQAVRKMGASLAPGFKKELDGGMDLYDIASPYMQSMAKILEMSPSSVSLFDPTIRKALAGSKSDKGGDVTTVPLYEFERQLKADPRWLKTKNAQDDLMGITHGLLQSFGLSAI